MPALTQDRPTPEREGRLMSNLLASAAAIYVGAMYALDAEGKATAATAASTNLDQHGLSADERAVAAACGLTPE